MADRERKRQCPRSEEERRIRALGAKALRRSSLFTWRAVAERLLRALGLPDVRADELSGDL